MEWKKKKWDVDDLFWEYADATPTGFICSCCSNAYHGSIGRIKWHLAKIEGRGIDICQQVDEEDVKRLRRDNFHVRIEQSRRRKRDCISTHLPSRKRVVTTNVVKTVGVHLLVTEFVVGQFDEYIQDVWSCLMDDHVVFRIGIHGGGGGGGGVGKTQVAKYINNKLLQCPNNFDHVFWVNMSPDWSTWNSSSPPRRVCDLQSCISEAVGVDLSEGDNETKRAAQLSKGLAEMKKTVLILDDVWDYISLQEVGVPVGVDRCTFIFTTRSLELCRQLDCQEKIEIRCLQPDESYELFKKNLGKETPLSREVEEISRDVADKCCGLPLAITIMSRNMKGVTDICQWRSALTGHMRKKADTEIFQKLKISYDYLKDVTLQHCFLCFPSLAEESEYQIFTWYGIRKRRLVEHFVDVGIIPRMNSRREELDDAHTKLNFLHDVGLLEVGSSYVHMNEVIRRMALQIMEDGNQRAMTKNYMSLKDLPDEESWTGDLVSVSLVGNEIKNIPPNYSPSCPKLSTLLLSRNIELVIGGIFFRGMPGLKVLDLSYTNIQTLPSSIDCLVNLTALLLSHCGNLRKFPSVGKLRALKKLDLSFSYTVMAEDTEMPSKLTYLNVCSAVVKLEPQVLAQLSRLQFLRLPLCSAVKGHEVAFLSRLETLICGFDDLVELNKYLVHLKGFKGREAPIQLNVRAGPGPMYDVNGFANYLFFDMHEFRDAEYQDFSVCILHDCNINESDMLIYFQQIAIAKCHEAISLCLFSPIKGATKLKYFSIRGCDGLELLCSLSSPDQDILENLEYMELSNLKNLSVLFKKEANVAYGSCFSNLTRFLIEGCPSIKRLFPIQLVPNLKNLQRLYVLNCLSMEEIFASEEEEAEESYLAGKKFCLSRLCILLLEDLPELRRVCGGRLTCVIPESCSVEYKNCPKLGLDGGDICRQ